VPEGDTVWLHARQLHEALAGAELTRSDFRVPRYATTDLTGRHVVESASRGKHLLLRIEGDVTLHTHLRMDGTWRVVAAGERWRGGPAHQLRVLLATSAHQALGFRLPVVELIRTSQEDRTVGHLGPDLLGPDWDADEAVRRLVAEPERELGPALLDQRNLAGIGNLYKAEVCFLHGLSPWLPVRDVPDMAAVVGTAHELLEANKLRWDQVTTGDKRPGRHVYVFERAGRPCWRCGTPVRVADQGDPLTARVTYWCPTCQPLA
jgi:endonuclease-8